VDEDELRRIYAESSGLFLLSDFEAFGIPILEALAVGTPVFLTDLDVTRSIFNLYRGARFCPGDDVEMTAKIVETSLERGAEAIDETLADRPRLEATFDWDVLAEQKWRALRSAWFGRHYIGRPFHGPHASIRSFPRPVHA
jgi:glycosyltransferase involved in cell wall biosynthesis